LAQAVIIRHSLPFLVVSPIRAGERDASAYSTG